MRCPNCGAELADEDKFCRACGAPRPRPDAGMSEGFAEARRRFDALRARYRAGEVDEATYEAQRRELMVHDEEGGYWAPGAERGEWYWYDGAQWVRRDPGVSSPRPVSPAATDGFPWIWVALGGGGLLVVGLLVAGVLLVPRLLSPSGRGPEPAMIVTDTSTPGATPTSLYSEMTAGAAAEESATFTPQPTEMASASSTATASPTASATASPTPSLVASPTATPSATGAATPTPTHTSEATPSATPSSEPSATTTTTPTPEATSSSPEATSPPSSGALIDFEQWGTWRRGDQPYGELTQSEGRAHSGRYAAELSYDFPVTEDDFVVFVRPLSLAGQPNTFSAWVYGDGSGNYLNVWVEDAQGEVWAVHLGQVGAAGWRAMSGKLDPEQPWPSGHVTGPDNGVVDYPVRFYALVLDRVGSGSRSGMITIDDVNAWRSEGTPQPTPGAAESTATPTVETPVSEGPLDFPEPTQLEAWENTDSGRRVTIMVYISGGSPPFTVSHEGTSDQTQKRDYPLVFTTKRCEIFGTITVESSDGQRASHDYWIYAPWCD